MADIGKDGADLSIKLYKASYYKLIYKIADLSAKLIYAIY